MLQHERHAEIVRRLRAEGTTEVRELARSLKVSSSTVRRDLAQLDREGTLIRVHGGAHVADDVDERMPFAAVAARDTADKQAVARRAVELVADGDVVLLDVGTTAMYLAQLLMCRRITVITGNLAAFDVLREAENIELILLGGLVRRPYHSLVGVLAEDALRQVSADIAFLSTSGVRPDGQILDTTLVEVPVKRAIVAAAKKTVLLADRHKFPGTGALRVCGAADIDMIVTNEGADDSTLRTCAAAGVEVVTG
ncbi:DeoR/GlpR family DNA-binding transcription regulator [Fodinicola feengrottensis]